MSDDNPSSNITRSSLAQDPLKQFTHDCNKHLKKTDASCVSVSAVTLNVKSFDRSNASSDFFVNMNLSINKEEDDDEDDDDKSLPVARAASGLYP